MALTLDMTPREIIREDTDELRREVISEGDDVLDAALNYFDRIAVTETIQAKLAARFAVRIEETITDEGAVTKAVKKGNIKEAIDAGLYETIATGFLDRVVRSTATIHTEGERWDWVVGEGDDAVPQEDVTELIAAIREKGNAHRAQVRADRLSVLLGSSVIHQRWMATGINYEPIPVQNVYIGHGGFVTEGGMRRPADNMSIDDALVVALALGNSDVVTSQQVEGVTLETGDKVIDSGGAMSWLAYRGASDKYPRGRCVQYVAHTWHAIPDSGAGVLDWTYDQGWMEFAPKDKIANPLTYAQQALKDYSLPTYPVAIYIGGDARYYREIMPRSGAELYLQGLEFDVAASQIMLAGLTQARGIFELHNEGGEPITLETWDRGLIETKRGQNIGVHSVPGINAQYAQLIQADQMKTAAEARGVPGWMVVSDKASQFNSGYQVDVMTEPLRQLRAERAKLNTTAVSRGYHVERGLLAAHTGILIPVEVHQLWDAGTYDMPTNDIEETQVVKADLEMQVIDYVEAVRTRRNLETRDEAKAWINEMKDDAEEYPAPKGPAPEGGAPSTGGGLFKRAKASQPTPPEAPPPKEVGEE